MQKTAKSSRRASNPSKRGLNRYEMVSPSDDPCRRYSVHATGGHIMIDTPHQDKGLHNANVSDFDTALNIAHYRPNLRNITSPEDLCREMALVQRAERARAARTEVLFGPFRLLPAQFLLLEGDKPVHLGSRALEILIVLLERPGGLISKQELMGRVWPNIFVEPANLTVHMSALRRALRDGRDGNRFIINVPGRGYSFVGSVELSEHENRARPTRAKAWQDYCA
jgi:DNA-binding winged helix-turn-helix (wHTH) protein